MPKKKQPGQPPEMQPPVKNPEIPDDIPAEPLLPEEDPDYIPGEEPAEIPPYGVPAPGEAP